MVKHMILWKLKDTVSDKEKVKAEIKAGLEGLKGVVPGIVEIVVQTNGLLSSNADVLLDSTFVDEDALKGYATHPAHVAVANERVRPYAEIRLCLDYEL
ncbi:MAG: Dabb family protein [Kiritimatiellae bacterium]|nr:Dabb family protein [Kiritimatiellia bacterium]